MIENNRRHITVSMMKAYPQLLRKFMSDKDKVAPLVEIIIYMNLEIYSLKRQEQVDSLALLCGFFILASSMCINFMPLCFHRILRHFLNLLERRFLSMEIRIL